LHLKNVNPKINLEQLNLKVPMELMDYPEHDGLAIAAVNSFGFGGTNAHAILSEAPDMQVFPSPNDEKLRIFPISARSEDGLMAMAEKYHEFLEHGDITSLYDLGYSMSMKRDHHPYRLGLVAKNIAELKDSLYNYIHDNPTLSAIHGRPKENSNGLVFVFTGMGPQWWKMGRELMETEPVFIDALKKCDEEFFKYAGWSLIEAMCADEETSEISQTKLAQPANFALQYGLIKLWESKGIKPDVIVGHSAGEVAAFYASGVLSFEDAIKVIYHRSSKQQRLTGKGKMMAVSLSKDAAKQLIESYEGLDIVAVNSHSGVTLVGEEETLAQVAEELTQQGVFNKFLEVSVPFHSRFMEEIKDDFMSGISDVVFNEPAVTLYSSAKGGLVTEKMNADYLWTNVRYAVYFADTIAEILDAGYTNFLEIGPHPALTFYLKEICAHRSVKGTFVSSLNRNQAEQATFYNSLACLYTEDSLQDFTSIYPQKGNFIKLPHYAWQREAYWVETSSNATRRLGLYDSILLGRKLTTAQPTWEVELKKELVPFLNHHCVNGNPLFPAAGYMEMALQLANRHYGKGCYKLEAIELKKAVFIQANKFTKLQITLDEEQAIFNIYNVSEADHPEHVAKGAFKQMQNFGTQQSIDLNILKSATSGDVKKLDKEAIYERFSGAGFEYTETFACIENIWIGQGSVVSKLKMPQVDRFDEYEIYPGVLDACFQGTIALESAVEGDQDIRLPVSVDEFLLYGPLDEEMWSCCSQVERTDSYTISDITLYNQSGEKIAVIGGFKVQSLENTKQLVPLKVLDNWLYDLQWPELENLTLDEDKITAANWIIFSDIGGVGARFASVLKKFGQASFLVSPGDELSIDEATQTATVRLNNEEDIKALYSAVRDDLEIKGIVHFWNLDLPENSKITPENVLSSGELGVYSVMNLLKASTDATDTSAKLWLVTKGAQAITAKEQPEVMQNAIWGTGRLIGNQEYISLWGGMVDLDPEAVDESLNMLAVQMLCGDEEDQLAYRLGRRYGARIKNTSHITKPLPVHMNESGSYMITGAFGALGRLTAEWLIEKGAKSLILLGRVSLPPRSEWQNSDLSDNVKDRVAFVQSLEAKGASIVVDALDFADEKAVKQYFTENAKKIQNVRGVISSLGIVKDMFIAQMPKETFDEVYETKVLSNWMLHKYFENQPLDFFVIFSSVAALITTAGQANYAAANAFLDGLVAYRRKNGLAGLSIAWGPWAVGMVKELDLMNAYRKKGLEPITAERGMQVLERLIHQNIPYTAVLETDWQAFKESGSKSRMPYLNEWLEKGLADGETELRADSEILKEFQEAYSSADEEARRQLLEEKIILIVSKVLHMKQEDIEMDKTLTELGLDSMLATELRNNIELKLGAVVNIIDLLGSQSLSHQIDVISDQLDTLLELNTIDDLLEDTSDEELDELLAQLEDMPEDEAVEQLNK
jgi:acyl transferase domain-containing protein